MLRMVIADDEILVREGIRSIINWKEYDIDIVGEASEGREAYEVCKKLNPDILFTDIRMPFMDGLQLAECMKNENPDIKIIIFSGIQDFNYAKSALDVSAEGYVLKPLEISELKDVVKKVVDKIQNEKNNKKLMEKLKEQLKENILAASEKFLRDLLQGAFSSKKEIKEKLEYFNEPISVDKNIMIAAITIDDYNLIKENYLEKDRQLLNFAVTNVTDEVIHKTTNGISLCMNENQFISIFNWLEDSPYSINEIFEEIKTKLNELLSISVSIGISRIVNSITDVPLAFKDSVSALQYRFYTGKNCVINSADISDSYNELEHMDFYEIETKLINVIKVGDVLETENIVIEVFRRLKSNNNYKMEYVQCICSEILLISSRSMYEAGENFDEIICDKSEMLYTLQNIENIFVLEDYMKDTLKKLAVYFSKKHTSKNDKIVLDIKRIISEEYMTEISVNKIAQSVFLSPNYISLIFKKETGVTITDYLTNIRIEKAKELLKDADLLIQQVSEMVGYEDASYFSKVFKKNTGIHPVRYRSFICG